MRRVKFAYNESMIGEFETENDLSNDEIIKEIERDFPEAQDIEIVSEEEINA